MDFSLIEKGFTGGNRVKINMHPLRIFTCKENIQKLYQKSYNFKPLTKN
ncbi:hypothetical protein FB2170_05540 [Maribacter sp. HTCC2170]|nr:hypothetical protein FB2170_05540 [Maribacter sp. HTCC2170]